MNKKIKFGLLGLAGTAFITLAATGLVTNNIFNTSADVDSHTLVFDRSGMTISDDYTSAKCVANLKYGGTISASMIITCNDFSYFSTGIGDDYMYYGIYYFDDDRYEGYYFNFRLSLVNVGKISKDDITINYGSSLGDYGISEKITIHENETLGRYTQEISFTYISSPSKTSSFILESVRVTYPCQ